MNDLNRRRLFEDSLMAVVAVSLPAPLFAADAKPVSANEKITAAIIDCGIRGKAHARELSKIADCDVTYVCDPERAVPAPEGIRNLRS